MVAIAIYTLAVVLGIMLGGNIIILSESEQNVLDDSDSIKNEGVKTSSFKKFVIEFILIGISLSILLFTTMMPFYLYERYIESKQKKLNMNL